MLERAKNVEDFLPQQMEFTENECEKLSEDGERKREGGKYISEGWVRQEVMLGETGKCVAVQRNRNERKRSTVDEFIFLLN